VAVPSDAFIDPDGIPFLQRIAEALENPLQSVSVSPVTPGESDDLDPTFAALAGACYSMADQLEKTLNEPDQFKKAQGLRNLVTQVRGLAEKYAENAAAEDYRRSMQNRIRRVESDEQDETAHEEMPVDPEPDARYAPKKDWLKGGENPL
jgi:hypothetical protein